MTEFQDREKRPCVLVFAGLDPSGGAGIAADIEAIAAAGAHALPVVTALTVQDNDRVFAVNPVDAEIIARQADVLIRKIPVAAVKVGIAGSRANAAAIADAIEKLREKTPGLPVVVDTVLGSGRGFSLADEKPEYVIEPLIRRATVLTPNLPEAERLSSGEKDPGRQAECLMSLGAENVLIKGGHGTDAVFVYNTLFTAKFSRTWRWERLIGEYHGTGCTLASAVAARLALGESVEDAVLEGQRWCQGTISQAFTIADGQMIPARIKA